MSSTNSMSSAARSAQVSVPTEYASNLGRALFQQKLESILLGTQESTGADGVAVSLKEDEVYICRASIGCAPELGVAVEMGQGLCGRCVAEAKAVVEQNLDGDIKSVAAVPVFKDESVYGFVAAFSQKTDAFSPKALDELQNLAGLIHNEVQPPIEFKLDPDAEQANDELLAQLGVTAPDPKAKVELAEADENFLDDLVRDVLQGAPSIAGIPEAPAPHLQPKQKDSPEPPPSFQSRTTEEVLMQVVDHSAPPKARPLPTPKKEPAKEEVVETKPASEKSKAAETRLTLVGAADRAPKIEKPTVTPKVTVTPAEETTKQPVKSAEETVDERAWRRPAVIGVALLLLIATSWLGIRYYRGRQATQPQQALAAAPEKSVAPEHSAPSGQPTTEKIAEKQPPVTPASPKNVSATESPKHEAAPLVIATTGGRVHNDVATEEAPAALNVAPGKITVPDIPTSSTKVVFGGSQSTGASAAKLIQRVNPNYPLMAKTLHLSGDVHLEATIGTDGRVKTVRAIDGHPVLVEAAADAVRRWRYQPATQNGKQVDSVVDVTVRFR